MENDVKNVSGAQFPQPAEDFKVAGPQVFTKFDFEDAPPPMGQYIDVNDQLDVVAYSTNALNVVFNLRILGVDGKINPLQFVFPITTSSRTTLRTRFPLIEGYLLSLTASLNSVSGNGGWTYAQCNLARAPFGLNQEYSNLLSGYLYGNVALGWPTATPQRPTDGPGATFLIVGSVPAPGADINELVPTNTRWRLISLRATLTTAVAAANRTVSLTADNAGNVYAESPSNFTQVASIVNTYNWFDSAPYVNAPFNLRTLAPLPSQMFLAAGHRIRTVTGAIQAADQWSAPVYSVLDWLDGV